MANKQYIYSGTGNPNISGLVPDSKTSHYLDDDSGEIWVYNDFEWQRIFVSGSMGNVAFYSSEYPPSYPPEGPSIYTSFENGNYIVHVSSKNADGEWIWIQMSATATV